MHRIAIIGAGGIAGMHARAIHDLENATLAAVARRSEEKARQFTQEHGGEAFGDYERMLDQAQPDMVTVCTPSGAHQGPVTACLERDIPVLCEKPIEIRTDRVDEMIALAESRGVALGGIFMQRYNPLMQTIHQAVSAGRFGALAAVNGYVPWWRDDAYYGPDRWQGTLELDGGGALMNQSIHVVDMVQWLAGAAMPDLDHADNPVEEVFAYTAKRGHNENMIEVEDTASVALRYRGGALGQLLGATSLYPGSLRRIQLGGRDGMAETLEDELITWQFREERSDDDRIRQQFGQSSETSGGASDPMAIDYANHRRNISAFLAHLDGEGPLMLDGRAARKAVAILEAVYASARTNQPQKVR